MSVYMIGMRYNTHINQKPSDAINILGMAKLVRSLTVGTIPHSPGVYQIRCIPTGKIYIGSSNDLARRWSEHRKMLRSDKHPNAHLQSAWNKYGEPLFAVSVLEVCSIESLTDREQYWIDATNCCDRTVGFNLSPTAENTQGYQHSQTAKDAMAIGHTKAWEGFIDPGGNEVTIVGLMDFCKEHGLGYDSMTGMAYGKPHALQHRGWTHRNAAQPRQQYKDLSGFIRPDGSREPTPVSIQAFCREHGLNWKGVYKLIKGEYKSHKGWRYEPGIVKEVAV